MDTQLRTIMHELKSLLKTSCSIKDTSEDIKELTSDIKDVNSDIKESVNNISENNDKLIDKFDKFNDDLLSKLDDIQEVIKNLESEKPTIGHQIIVENDILSLSNIKSITYTVLDGSVDITTPSGELLTYPIDFINGATFSHTIIDGTFKFDASNGKVFINYLI